MDISDVSNKFVLKNIGNNISDMNNSPKSSLKLSAVDCNETTDLDVSKENFNPRPLRLSEIADRTLKETKNFTGTSTSTPNFKQKQHDNSDLDSSQLVLPHLPQPLSEKKVPNDDFNISLLTAGFNKMGIIPGECDPCNITSDEDESFVEAVQSFTDYNNEYHSNATIVKEEFGDDLENSPVNILTNLNDRTFDQVEIESKTSDESIHLEEAPVQEQEELTLEVNVNNLELTHVIDDDQDEFDAYEMKAESEDVEMPSVVNLNITNVVKEVETQQIEDDFDGNKTNDDEHESSEVKVNPFSPTIPEFRNIDDLSNEMRKESAQVFNNKMDDYLDIEFKMPADIRRSLSKNQKQSFDDGEFKDSASVNFSDSDFDFIEHFGGPKRSTTNRLDSVLMTFDPLLSRPVIQKTRLLPATQEESELLENSLKQEQIAAENTSHDSHIADYQDCSSNVDNEMSTNMRDLSAEPKIEITHCEKIKQEELNEEKYFIKMAEMENKIKQEAEIREEALLKRISEKDKQIAKMNGVVEAYEKAISELIAEKEQLIVTYDKKCNDLKNDSELNANHLTSLEATFSDLHAKYERTKHLTQDLHDREKTLITDRKTLNESLKMQEARYDKMKSHAMAQLEIANNTLAEMNRSHQAESTKLKALLKKEEIARASINEQLVQKSKENSELVKICDELINGTQSN